MTAADRVQGRHPARLWTAEGGALTLPRLFWLLWLGYGLLAFVYATVTPLFEKPDENWHFAFAMHWAERGQLPIQQLEARDHLAEQEGSQPPLYYGLLAALLKVGGLDNLRAGYEALTEANPYYGGRPAAWLDNASRWVHGPCEGDCQRTARAVWVGRGLSIACGLAALLAAAVAVRLAFPDEPLLLLAVVGALGFNPQFLHLSSSVSNDALLMATVNLTLALALWWRREAASGGRVVALGAAAGLATLAKLSGLSVAVVVGLLVALAPLPLTGRLRQLGRFGGAFGLVSGWWFARNWGLYGEPTGTQIHLAIYGVPPALFSWGRLVAEWQAVANSYWASFGWGGINLPNGVYGAATVLAALLALAFALVVACRWRGWSVEQRTLVGASLLQIGVVGGLLFRWMRLTVAPLGRLLFPAALPIALILVIGLLGVVPRRWQGWVTSGFVAGWAGVALTLALMLIRPAYAPASPVAALPAGAVPLDIRFGDSIALVGYEAPTETLAPGEVVPVTLFWRALKPLDGSFSVGFKLFGRGEQLLAASNSFPDGGRWPTRGWPVGPLIPDRIWVQVGADAAPPTLARAEIDLFRHTDLNWLPATVGGEPVRPLRPFSLVVRAAGERQSPPSPFRFRPTLDSLTLEPGAVRAQVVWEVGQPLESDFQAFLHLAPSEQAPPAAQTDFEPQRGAFPTSFWQPGDRLWDEATLPLPSDAPPGDYLLLLGLYDLATGGRVAGEMDRRVWTLARLRWDRQTWRVLPESEAP